MHSVSLAGIIALGLASGGILHAQEKKEEKPAEKPAPAAETKFKQPVKFTFQDENGKPLEGTFTIHKCRNGKYVRNIKRYEPLDENGSITIEKFPAEFEFGASSNDKFYSTWTESKNLDPAKGEFLQRCQPTGGMKFDITEFPAGFTGKALVVEYHRKTKEGAFKPVKGIGIHTNDPPKTIGSLEPGEYFIAIKFEYKDPKAFYKSDVFQVEVKKYAELPKIKVTEEDIARSKE